MNCLLISGSAEELGDLKRAYLDGKGDMDFILEAVPFTHTDEESRLRGLIQGLIERGDVPEYKAFTDETPRKRERRKRKVIKCVTYLCLFTILLWSILLIWRWLSRKL
jgi:DnaJ family protein C protein 9